jgi:chromosome segregation ATPase
MFKFAISGTVGLQTSSRIEFPSPRSPPHRPEFGSQADQLLSLRAQLDTSNQRQHQLQQKSIHLKQRYAELMADHGQTFTAMDTLLHEKQSRPSALLSTTDTLKTKSGQNFETERTVSAGEIQNRRLHQELSFQAVLAETNRQNHESHRALLASSSQTEAQLNKHSDLVRALRKDLDASNQEKNFLTTRVEQMNVNIQQLVDQNQNLQNQVLELTEQSRKFAKAVVQVKQLRSESIRIRERLQNLGSENASLADELECLRAEKSDLLSEAVSLTAKFNEAQVKLTENSRQMDELEMAKERAQEYLLDAIAVTGALRVELKRVLGQLDDSRKMAAKKQQFTRQIAALESERDGLRQVNDFLSQTKAHAERSLEAVHRDYDVLLRQFESSRSSESQQLEDSVLENRYLKAVVVRLQEQFEALAEKNLVLMDRMGGSSPTSFAELQRENEELKRLNASLVEETDEIRKELSKSLANSFLDGGEPERGEVSDGEIGPFESSSESGDDDSPVFGQVL